MRQFKPAHRHGEWDEEHPEGYERSTEEYGVFLTYLNAAIRCT